MADPFQPDDMADKRVQYCVLLSICLSVADEKSPHLKRKT